MMIDDLHEAADEDCNVQSNILRIYSTSGVEHLISFPFARNNGSLVRYHHSHNAWYIDHSRGDASPCEHGHHFALELHSAWEQRFPNARVKPTPLVEPPP